MIVESFGRRDSGGWSSGAPESDLSCGEAGLRSTHGCVRPLLTWPGAISLCAQQPLTGWSTNGPCSHHISRGCATHWYSCSTRWQASAAILHAATRTCLFPCNADRDAFRKPNVRTVVAGRAATVGHPMSCRIVLAVSTAHCHYSQKESEDGRMCQDSPTRLSASAMQGTFGRA